jgi:hypothetical protein
MLDKKFLGCWKNFLRKRKGFGLRMKLIGSENNFPLPDTINRRPQTTRQMRWRP